MRNDNFAPRNLQAQETAEDDYFVKQHRSLAEGGCKIKLTLLLIARFQQAARASHGLFQLHESNYAKY